MLLVYAGVLLAGGSLHDLVPTQGGGVVLAANGVRVNVGGRPHGRVAEARGDGREVHAVGQQEARPANRDVDRCVLAGPSGAGARG